MTFYRVTDNWYNLHLLKYDGKLPLYNSIKLYNVIYNTQDEKVLEHACISIKYHKKYIIDYRNKNYSYTYSDYGPFNNINIRQHATDSVGKLDNENKLILSKNQLDREIPIPVLQDVDNNNFTFENIKMVIRISPLVLEDVVAEEDGETIAC